jgi:hypothetical protein
MYMYYFSMGGEGGRNLPLKSFGLLSSVPSKVVDRKNQC